MHCIYFVASSEYRYVLSTYDDVAIYYKVEEGKMIGFEDYVNKMEKKGKKEFDYMKTYEENRQTMTRKFSVICLKRSKALELRISDLLLL